MTHPKIDAYVEKAGKWREEVTKLRAIALDCPLVEDFKWGHPCYTSDGANIVLIHGFKEYCALLFFKGALMTDPNGILIQQTENVQAGRQIRFTNSGEIAQLAPTLKAYILEAIAVEKAGLKVDFKPTREFAVPEEFQSRLDSDATLKAAFDALTPGRQRGYLLHLSSAKQAKTRLARIEKCAPLILAGKGLDD
ncbi:YdeI/OmpD-associated family protein [Nitrospirillum amazonense]|uniref:YdeI/OmpD-associated family protein n=1 Tax=Nitrospirillum amazonense TaxID=28077 RepID=UPI002412CC9D|nr:YdeI/OmpD-associated family protein [Nitrospirillum amazonense]MDG3441625.1 YdeI/OmpD-associated family protein [Nitrospirillum amazonense]